MMCEARGLWCRAWYGRLARVGLAILALALSSAPTHGQSLPERSSNPAAGAGVVLGRLTGSTGEPVVNAMVHLSGSQGVLSDSAGSFVLRDVAAGLHAIVVTSLGWRTAATDTFRVRAGDTTFVTLSAMVREAIPLPEVLVAPGTFGLLEEVSPGTVRALTREEIETRPQLGEDIFRAVNRLPGVASHDISTRLTIRGGTDREVLMRLDGLELYEPYHLKDWEGALGIVDLNAVGGVEVITGGFGSEFGDRLTGVFDMTSRTAVGAPTTTLGVSISNLTALSTGGFDDDRGSWLLSARRGFMDLVMSLAGEGNRFSPEYHDIFAKVRYQVAPHHVVGIHALRAGDGLVFREAPLEGPDTVDLESGWESSYAWATWDATLGRAGSASTTGWVGRLTRSRSGLLGDADDSPLHVQVNDDRVFTFGGLRSDLSVELTPDALLKVGAEAKRLRANYNYLGQAWHPFVTAADTRAVRVDTTLVKMAPTGTEYAAYAALRARPLTGWTTEVGLRYDRASHTGDRGISPRFLTSLDVASGTTLRGSWGVYRQSQGIHELEVGDGGTTYLPSERAELIAVGLERRMGQRMALRVEAYRRAVTDPHPEYVNAQQELQVFPEAAGDRIRIGPARARSRGIEVVLERKAGARWAWSASYVLAQAEDEVNGRWIPRRYDQRHTLSVFASYLPRARWNLSVSWQYHTGWPATAWSYDVQPLADGGKLWTRLFGPIRGIRVPAYHRLDLRLSRSFKVRGNTLDAFVDLFNVYDHLNLASYDYLGSYDQGRLSVRRGTGQELLPFLPTFGVRYVF
jgi:TonB dependent receptor-like, beta-barrel/TonB-dependent Receptor Plug Domain/Carboxypeptidase regulatory-like domain